MKEQYGCVLGFRVNSISKWKRFDICFTTIPTKTHPKNLVRKHSIVEEQNWLINQLYKIFALNIYYI